MTDKENSPMDMSLGTVNITTPKTQLKRMSMVLWGPSGSGKTTLASTAPKPILYVNFDPDGTSSLEDMEDVYVADFSMENSNKVVTFKHENAGGIKQLLEEHNEIQTVVFDSITSFNEMALKHGVEEIRGATMEMPTLQGYGRRNSYTMQAIMSVIKCTGAFNKHCIFIAHEDTPSKDELTGAMMVSILVGGKMQSEIPIKLSEVWHLEDTGKERKITIRSSRLRKPMKSRMFIQSESSDFTWRYDPDSREGGGIEDWYNAWIENEGRKLELP